MATRQLTEALQILSALGQGRDSDQAELVSQTVIFGTAARCNVNDPGPLGLADLFPGNDSVAGGCRWALGIGREGADAAGGLLGGEVVEGALVGEPDQLAAL